MKHNQDDDTDSNCTDQGPLMSDPL